MLLAPVKNDKFKYEHLFSRPQNIDEDFIIPTVNYGAELFGIQAIHIYALPEDDLIDHYGSFGFSRLPPEMEEYIHQHLKPDYDNKCIFMYQIL